MRGDDNPDLLLCCEISRVQNELSNPVLIEKEITSTAGLLSKVNGFRAAADGDVLQMEHLVQAVFQEFQKESKVLLSSEFGEYGVMFSGCPKQV